eukprot:scaffold309_cov235-Pinguiococcus_pyrenoidosus.AAC.27
MPSFRIPIGVPPSPIGHGRPITPTPQRPKFCGPAGVSACRALARNPRRRHPVLRVTKNPTRKVRAAIGPERSKTLHSPLNGHL